MTHQAVRRAGRSAARTRGCSPARAATSTTSGRGALAAAFVRSPHAHARIRDIDVADALDVDGLVAIYTYEDLPGAGRPSRCRC